MWPTLLGYHHEAVRRDSACAPVPLAHRGDWWVPLAETRETIVTGRGDDLEPSAALAGLFDKLRPNEEVFVGWPLLVLSDLRGQRQVAPLFMTRLEAPYTPGGHPVAADDNPYLNPAITLGGEFFAMGVIAEAESHVPPSGLLPFTDPQALAGLATRMLDALGLGPVDLDIDHLDQTPPREVGVYNALVAVRGEGGGPTAGLLEELSDLRWRDDWHRTAARWLIESAPAEDEHASTSTPLCPAPLQPLSDGQQQAAAMAATARLTAVKGPPGTGKSELVATIVADAWERGESVLVASTNNGAVNVAADRCQKIDDGLLIRTGNKSVREALPEVLEQLAERVPDPAPSPEITRRRLDIADGRRRAIIEAIAERSRLDAALAQAALDRDETAILLWGQPHPPAAVAGQYGWALRRARRLEVAPRLFPRWRLNQLRRAVAASNDAVEASDVVAWARTAHRFDELHEQYDALGPDKPDETYAELSAAGQELGAASRAVLTPKVQESLRAAAVALRQLARVRTGDRAARVAATGEALAAGARGWACTALSIRGNFPLRAGLFDLVVVDEASQCGVADLIPLAYRARRLVVIGDPNQLAPVVTLTGVQLRALAAAAGASHDQLRANGLSAADSAFAAVTTSSRKPGPPAPFLLDEHRRCHPEIAAFCNDQFYGGTLQILTDTNDFEGEPRGLTVLPVTGALQRGPNGASWVNNAEVNATVDWLTAHIETADSVGVVTPYKAQRQAIEDELARRVGHKTAATVAVGTVNTFQGDQREVMLFSPVLTDQASDRAVRWIEDNRRLINVAVSRAQRALVVVTDPDAVPGLAAPTLVALLDAASRNTDAAATTDLGHRSVPADERTRLLHSRAETALYTALRAWEVPVDLKPVEQGYELDFALHTPNGPVDIECDGIHHHDARGRQRRQDLARDAILKRAGWQVLRYPSWRCLLVPDNVANDIITATGLFR
ncbi:AAA domain-containing protein [Actinomycetospora sp. TBRC 11914]|uniref:AAA domain-containing protein n=1 Tax=Actinomycetospora sp. TBRC 11914 TaxID=2729387 RepID=UPI00145EBE9B|nr:AAA domain-containing protein [Actinomycetospora sp. TBRC 11914]NMO93918.1 AAA family ATPase [Actinomycetospora sp. TBRC 11914]